MRCTHRRKLRFVRGVLLPLLVLIALSVSARPVSNLRIVSTPLATPQAQTAVQMLRDEVRKRSGGVVDAHGVLLVVARREQIAELLPQAERRQWRKWLRSAPTRAREACNILSLGNVLIVAGDDDRGILFGIGFVLRKAEMSPGHIRLPGPVDVRIVPRKHWRAHQIGYRFKNNSYDAFTLPMFEQQIRDLAVFGANGVQWIAPVSDDAPTSPLFPAPPLEMAIGVSKLMRKYGLDFDLYYPEMGDDYAQPATVTAELARFENLVRQLPKIDALFVPGGDPGHTAPEVLVALVKQQAAILHRYHPKATVWISGQGFDRTAFERFYGLLRLQPDWLNGVFFGPQSRDALETQRANIPPRYPILFYPDIAHTMHAQFPVPRWDPAFALTEGREPVAPRPRAMAHIFRHFVDYMAGYVTYSEGVTDDVNKMLWSALGMNPNEDVDALLADYGRYFIGDAHFGASLAALERNWDGPVTVNNAISATLADLQAIHSVGNWRYDMALYRAVYDHYVQRRATAEAARYETALAELRSGNVSSARTALVAPDDGATLALRARLFELAETLYRHIGLQLSVELYGASSVERGANLDRVDVPLNDKRWLIRQLDEIEALPEREKKNARLRTLAAHDVAKGAYYDDLGNPQAEPHLVRGPDFASDPELYRSAIDGIADMTPADGWRMNWITYAESLYETPLHLHYASLDPTRRYRLKIVYAGEDYALPIKLTANDAVVLHDFTPRTTNPMTLELDVPRALTAHGTLDLYWTRPTGMGGSGRGCQVAEVWLLPLIER